MVGAVPFFDLEEAIVGGEVLHALVEGVIIFNDLYFILTHKLLDLLKLVYIFVLLIPLLEVLLVASLLGPKTAEVACELSLLHLGLLFQVHLKLLSIRF